MRVRLAVDEVVRSKRFLRRSVALLVCASALVVVACTPAPVPVEFPTGTGGVVPPQ